MVKEKEKRYNVSRRFIIWVDTEVLAKNLHEAVDKAEALKVHDFVDFGKSGLNDWEPLEGTSISESW